MKKKYKKALAAGIAGTLGAGLLKQKLASATGVNIDKGRGSKLGETYRKQSSYKDAIMRGGKGVKQGTKIGITDKIKNFFKDEVFTTSPKSKVFTIPKRKTPIGDLPDFGLGDMDGAKSGKMIKARGGGLARSKPTKLI